jgi:pyruvate dehydrogenase E1 component beta subunit
MESELMYGDKGEVPEETYYVEIGKAKVISEGTDVTLVGFGKIMKVVIAAAAELAKEGISAEVIDLRTVRPIDYDTIINSVKKTNRMVFIEESWPLGSIATEVAFKVQKDAFDYLDAPVLRIMGGDVPLPYAPTLIQEYLPNPERVIKAVKEVMYVTK